MIFGYWDPLGGGSCALPEATRRTMVRPEDSECSSFLGTCKPDMS